MMNKGMSLSGWMSELPDTLKLSQISIPGTHNSCAIHKGKLKVGLTNAKCQNLLLKEQLNAGVRFLDIRGRHIHESLAIHHGQVFQELYLNNVVSDCKDFLQCNKNECIIILLKKEHDSQPNNNEDTYEKTFDKYVSDAPSLWYLESEIPTLGKVRGKIVLIRRFSSKSVKGIDATYWEDDKTFSCGKLQIQDQYNIKPISLSVSDKKKWIKAHLETAKTGASDSWYINYTSAAGIRSPKAIAKDINPWLSGILKQRDLESRLGTILMDFPDIEPNLINQIISFNQSLKAPKFAKSRA